MAQTLSKKELAEKRAEGIAESMNKTDNTETKELTPEEIMNETDKYIQSKSKVFFKLEDDEDTAVVEVIGGFGRMIPAPLIENGRVKLDDEGQAVPKRDSGGKIVYNYEFVMSVSQHPGTQNGKRVIEPITKEDEPQEMTWETNVTNYKKWRPQLKAGHRLFSITRHGERGAQQTMYSIKALDK